jgi:phosphoribosylanthranilate isomerase
MTTIPSPLCIKICGIDTLEAAKVVTKKGVNYIGFIFDKKSPKYIEPSKANKISEMVSTHVRKAGVFVDPSDEEITQCLNEIDLDCIQLNGNESKDRVQFINLWFSYYPLRVQLEPNENLPAKYKKERKVKRQIMKAIRVATKKDLGRISIYEKVADLMLYDTRPTPTRKLPTSSAQTFEWSIFNNVLGFISGKINEKNILSVLKTGTKSIDISSGLENEMGEMSIEKINSFFKFLEKNN